LLTFTNSVTTCRPIAARPYGKRSKAITLRKKRSGAKKNKKVGREVLVVTDENLSAGRVAIEEGGEVTGSQEETASEKAETSHDSVQNRAKKVTLSAPIPLGAPIEERSSSAVR
jgi:hypothetical protein